ncbi:LOW QUALITY PROTEIN: N-acetyltransferase family 8 member 7-like [Dermochelys coriacea]|uniref:LOW QUALITY PROTEIN: N-acetyltransferase family 8 member 7-like n=1 Tax=Dermochelys coriacea TaxID=27794 RepID=UPI001CA8891E|nr:LOW QUALITY PROTEIN: N-acetyltransferase family 8 member 7-like [Dermochelys coriacea]
MHEHVPKNYLRMLTLPWAHLLLLGVSLALFLSSSSLLSLMAPVLLPAGWLLMDSYYVQYIERCLREDLWDIQKTYMEREDSHFWVAESEGEVVAIVSAKPCPVIQMECPLELAWLSVRWSHRNRGIARALSRTVLSFAQQHGYKAVILDVSMVNLEGQRL